MRWRCILWRDQRAHGPGKVKDESRYLAELFVLNKNVDALIRVLQRIDALGLLQKPRLKAMKVWFEEVQRRLHDTLETLLMARARRSMRLRQQRKTPGSEKRSRRKKPIKNPVSCE